MTKTGTLADLAFTYSNNDPGLAIQNATTVMNLNGRDNQVEFPLTTTTPPANATAKLVWGGDTNLYRSASNTLQTDDDLVVGALAPTARCCS